MPKYDALITQEVLHPQLTERQLRELNAAEYASLIKMPPGKIEINLQPIHDTRIWNGRTAKGRARRS